MKCNKCENDYPSDVYFKTPGLCENCYNNMTEEERHAVDLQIMYHKQYYLQHQIVEQRIGFGRRLGAYLIDYLIITIISGIILYVSGFMGAMTQLIEGFTFNVEDIQAFSEKVTELSVTYFSTIVFNQFIQLFYYSLEIILGASIGKLLLGIQIADMNGKLAPTSQLAKRFAFKHSGEILALIALIPFFGFLGFMGSLMSLVIIIGCFFVLREDRLSLHDKWSKTAVFRKEYLESTNNKVNNI